MRFSGWLGIWTLMVFPGCSYDFGATQGNPTDSESHGSTVDDTDTDTDTGSAADTGSGPDTGSTATETGSGSGTDTGSASEPGTDSPSETLGSDDSESADSSSDTAAPLWLRYYESIGFMYSYGSHRILVGPATSTAPESSDWTEVASAGDMYNAAAQSEWAEGHKVNLSAYHGTSIRLAFHYEATSGDDWKLDDVCLTTNPDEPYPFSCLWKEDFDGTDEPTLPPGWSVVEGPGSSPGGTLWEPDGIMTMGDYHSEPNCMWIYCAYSYSKNAYLVSPPILLP